MPAINSKNACKNDQKLSWLMITYFKILLTYVQNHCFPHKRRFRCLHGLLIRYLLFLTASCFLVLEFLAVRQLFMTTFYCCKFLKLLCQDTCKLFLTVFTKSLIICWNLESTQNFMKKKTHSLLTTGRGPKEQEQTGVGYKLNSLVDNSVQKITFSSKFTIFCFRRWRYWHPSKSWYLRHT